MIKRLLAYFFKCIYLLISWFVIVYACSGEINETLFCISIFTYSGGVAFDSLFYFYDAYESNTILRGIIKFVAALSFGINFVVAMLSLVCNYFITIIFDDKLQKYLVKLVDSAENGIANLYPEILTKNIELSELMLYVMGFAVSSLIPAILLEIDSFIRIINDKNKKVDESKG